MDRFKRDELLKKVSRYDKLTEKISCMYEVVEFPEYIKDKYNGRECWMDVEISFGDGSSRARIRIEESETSFKNIIKEINNLKDEYEAEIDNM